MKNENLNFENLIDLFKETQEVMKNQAAKSVDLALVIRNWLFGLYIFEFEQKGQERATYGENFIPKLSKRLKNLDIRSSSPTRLKLYRKFYKTYSSISPALPDKLLLQKSPTLSVQFTEMLERSNILSELYNNFKLSWSHYVVLLTINSQEERKFYEIESETNSWGIRELKRQVESSLYERLALSRDEEKIKELSEKGHLVANPEDIIKSPYILEFLDLPEHPHYSEHQLETAIIDKIEHFLLELGKGFLFEARQKRFTFDDDHFYVDLVFYNRLLRCYVLIDLKRDKLTHQDLGQMQMYVNYFDRYVKLDDEKPTIGIVLCHRKNDALVELTLPEKNNIHASEYQLYLPSKEELKKQLTEVQQNFETSNQKEEK